MGKNKIDYDKVCEMYAHGVSVDVICEKCNVNSTAYVAQIVSKSPFKDNIRAERKQMKGVNGYSGVSDTIINIRINKDVKKRLQKVMNKLGTTTTNFLKSKIDEIINLNK